MSNTKGERALAALRAEERPSPEQELPGPSWTRQLTLRWDPADIRLVEAVGELLGAAGQPLELLVPQVDTWSMAARKQLQQRVRVHRELGLAYERLIRTVVAPHLAQLPAAAQLARPDSAGGWQFSVRYQFPPTLRVHPAGSRKFRRVHRDAEYGHQPGEINFWLPLTDAGQGRASLWVEPESGQGEMAPLVLAVGQFAQFYGVERQHTAPGNLTEFCRVSLDFRVAPAVCYDERWSLISKGEMKIEHEMRQMSIPYLDSVPSEVGASNQTDFLASGQSADLVEPDHSTAQEPG